MKGVQTQHLCPRCCSWFSAATPVLAPVGAGPGHVPACTTRCARQRRVQKGPGCLKPGDLRCPEGGQGRPGADSSVCAPCPRQTASSASRGRKIGPARDHRGAAALVLTRDDRRCSCSCQRTGSRAKASTAPSFPPLGRGGAQQGGEGSRGGQHRGCWAHGHQGWQVPR